MSGTVVVGNGVSGYACAARLAELGAAVTMIGPGLPHDRPPLSKRALAAGGIRPLATAEDLVAAGIAHVDGLVTEVDPATLTLTVETADGHSRMVQAEKLVWATGLAAGRPPVPGAELMHMNATSAALDALAPRLAEDGRDVVVIGAGLVGAESAATLAARHRVTLCDVTDRPLARFHPAVADAAGRALADAGVRVLNGCGILEIQPGAVRTAGHGVLAADVVLAATGMRPTIPRSLGAEGPSLDTDETLAVIGRRNIWACGDAARFPHPRFGRIAIPHWDHALASGRHAAEAVLGARDPYVRDPYWFSDIGRVRIQQLGPAEAAAEWQTRDGLVLGLAGDGRPCCVILIDQPRRLREARELMAA
jgi:3-phenylpropionate/trans-cinnamate dioxygenase ferredoxin reductase component